MLLSADIAFIETFFSEQSPFKTHLPTFQPRLSQLQMAQAVTEAINDQHSYLIEAGTGTGKSFAYLLPALLAKKPIIISTGTKHLQDQLLHKDLPLLLQALPNKPKVVVLKGRNNYLCQHRMGLQIAEGHFQFGPHRDTFQHLVRWQKRTDWGDLNEVATPSDSTPWWPAITSTADNCLGKECHDIGECFVYKNRKAALEADVVIVNHHVLLAHLALQRDEISELLPKAATVIVDEAHHLVDIAPQFFSDSMSSRQLYDWLRDCELEYQSVGADMPGLSELLQQTIPLLQAFRAGFGDIGQKRLWQQRPEPQIIADSNQALMAHLEKVGTVINQIAERSKGLANCAERSVKLLQQWRQLTGDAEDESVSHWYETYKTHIHVTKTPLIIGEQFQQALSQMADSWVFTSATLTIDQSFSYFEHQLGLETVKTLCLDSPFDYAQQALWCVPEHLPEPNHPRYSEAFIDVVRTVLQASQGRAFVLFTSHKAMQQALLACQDLPYPILVQGAEPKHVLLNRFRQLANGVLFGTQSFWEGVDVQGEALSCVIIDKLPFAVPDDPVHEGQVKALRAAGQNPFQHYHLPRAVISLKQGAGRLIRDRQDRGVLVVCDVRLITRPYRRAFIQSLPPFKRTRNLQEVKAFFGSLK